MARTWLRNLRNERGMNGNAVAKKLGVSRQMYSYIEHGQRWTNLNLRQMQALSKVFKISTSTILKMESGTDDVIR